MLRVAYIYLIINEHIYTASKLFATSYIQQYTATLILINILIYTHILRIDRIVRLFSICEQCVYIYVPIKLNYRSVTKLF